MVVFEKCRWRNINATGDIFTEVDLETSPLTLFVGKNGAGKTTLLDVLCFVLYNKPFRKINKDKLINSVNGKNALGEVFFRISGNRYLVRRGMKPNVFELFINDILVPKDAKSADYQKIVQSHLRMDLKSFLQIGILGSRSFIPFMRLEAGERRAVIEDMLDLKVFTSMNAVVKEKLEASDERLLDLNSQIRVAKDNLSLEHRRMAIARENVDETKAKLRARDLELDADMAALAVQRDDHQAMLNDITKEVKNRSKLVNDIQKMRSIRSRVIDKRLDCLDAVTFYKDNDDCPTCHQKIDKYFKQTEYKRLEAEKQEYTDKLTLVEEKLLKANQDLTEMDKVVRKINELNTNITIAQATLDSIVRQRKQINNDINDLEGRSLSFEGIQDDIAQWTETLDHATTLKNDVAKQVDYLKAASLILKDNGIKAKIIKQYIPIINTLINKYLSQMNFRVNFELNETFSETIKSKYREAFSYEQFSEGEKLRLDLAIMFTWRDIAKLRNTTSMNILIMDEILDASLDEEGIDDFMKIIKDLVAGTNTIIISHNQSLSHDNFDSVSKFEKRKDFSHRVVAK